MKAHRIASAVLSAAALTAAGCAAQKPTPPAIVGSWRSSVQFESGSFAPIKNLEFMYVFNEGGTLTESSNYDAAPPVPPAYGAWRALGTSQFEARYEFFVTTPSDSISFPTGAGWLPSGRGVLTERITLSADQDSFTSTIHYEALGPNGEHVEGGGDAHGHAVRIALPKR